MSVISASPILHWLVLTAGLFVAFSILGAGIISASKATLRVDYYFGAFCILLAAGIAAGLKLLGLL